MAKIYNQLAYFREGYYHCWRWCAIIPHLFPLFWALTYVTWLLNWPFNAFKIKHKKAKKAVEIGVSGIVVSNHGARQLDYTPATISVLEEVMLLPKLRDKFDVNLLIIRHLKQIFRRSFSFQISSVDIDPAYQRSIKFSSCFFFLKKKNFI